MAASWEQLEEARMLVTAAKRKLLRLKGAEELLEKHERKKAISLKFDSEDVTLTPQNTKNASSPAGIARYEAVIYPSSSPCSCLIPQWAEFSSRSMGATWKLAASPELVMRVE